MIFLVPAASMAEMVIEQVDENGEIIYDTAEEAAAAAALELEADLAAQAALAENVQLLLEKITLQEQENLALEEAAAAALTEETLEEFDMQLMLDAVNNTNNILWFTITVIVAASLAYMLMHFFIEVDIMIFYDYFGTVFLFYALALGSLITVHVAITVFRLFSNK